MSRFSVKAKEIHDEILYNTDVEKAKSLIEELQDPLDFLFGKSFIAYHYLLYQQHDELLEILAELESENKKIKDQFLQFLINFYYCNYYCGFNNPTVSKEQAKIYMEVIENNYKNIEYEDDWEKYYIQSR